MSLPTEKLTAHLTDAKQALALLPDHVDREPLIQMALQALMESGDNVVERFIELAEEQPEVFRKFAQLDDKTLDQLVKQADKKSGSTGRKPR